MRWLGVVFASLTMLCLLCAPTLAQSSPSASQYEPCPPGSDSDACAASSVDDSVRDVVENAEQGTDAVNDAMDDAAEGSASASASPEAVLATKIAASPEAAPSPGPDATQGSEAPGGEPGSITELPETGGAPLAALGSGALLMILGLTARRLARR